MSPALTIFLAALLLGLPLQAKVTHLPAQPRSGEEVKIVFEPEAKPEGAVALEIQAVEPGHYIARNDPRYLATWTSLPMTNVGGIFSVSVPGNYQTHRRLIRYRIKQSLGSGQPVYIPTTTNASPNFAYFVYDGVPAWKAAINPKSDSPGVFPAEVMRSIQVYHLISTQDRVERATWKEQSREKDYRYTGTLIADGKVYDHVRFRARGGDWRHAMGKNMWKVDFNSGEPLLARDDYGQPYRSVWGKLNLRACIQQGDYGHRGEQGMFEAVGFRLFNLAGVDAPRTHWVHWRMITSEQEAPASQYEGDFWGLYLAIENEDGRFLKEHGLPDGNVYKMMYGTGELSHQAANAATNGLDLQRFQIGINRNSSETWWRTNLDLPSYYSYRSILEAIHHYDIGAGKNYDFYLNPVSQKWATIPWDIDLTWADNMFGDGNEPFRSPVLRHPKLKLEYENRLREIRDLLYNPEQTGALIDECAAIIHPPGAALAITDADRAKWDYHPIMVSQYVVRQKAGQGRFYKASRTGDFAGMAQLMKDYVVKRSKWIDDYLLRDSVPLAAPIITQLSTGVFKANPGQEAGVPTVIRWRIGEVAPASKTKPGKYEVTPIWESADLPLKTESVQIPTESLQKGHTYRVRAQAKDAAGRWSHWSRPVDVRP